MTDLRSVTIHEDFKDGKTLTPELTLRETGTRLGKYP